MHGLSTSFYGKVGQLQSQIIVLLRHWLLSRHVLSIKLRKNKKLTLAREPYIPAKSVIIYTLVHNISGNWE